MDRPTLYRQCGQDAHAILTSTVRLSFRDTDLLIADVMKPRPAGETVDDWLERLHMTMYLLATSAAAFLQVLHDLHDVDVGAYLEQLGATHAQHAQAAELRDAEQCPACGCPGATGSPWTARVHDIDCRQQSCPCH